MAKCVPKPTDPAVSPNTSATSALPVVCPSNRDVDKTPLPAPARFGGALPINPSGGVLSTNPIGASGMIRFAEAAQQVRGRAGEHQVDGARTAVGHAYGGASQFFAMWVVSSASA